MFWKIKRRRTIRFIFLAFAILTALILLIPLIPQVMFYLNPPKIEKIPIVNKAESDNTQSIENENYNIEENRLYIPKIGVDTKILEGTSEDILLQEEGVWREPETSIPGSGNMVIAGHRFQFLPPNTTTFYHLDKLVEGDQVEVYWEGKKHVYKIYQILEVEPTDTWIKDVSENAPELTLYTCTPIYTSENRLVVKAKEVM